MQENVPFSAITFQNYALGAWPPRYATGRISRTGWRTAVVADLVLTD